MPVFTSSIEVTADYPTIKPSLNLNFARARALDSRITFTRASVGTYVGRDGLIKTAGDNEPRFDHDPVTLESLGLLIEESRSNSWTYSQPTSSASFGSNGTFTYNAATAPNGETEAFRLARNGSNSSNSYWRATRAINFNADAMVLSVWAKGEGGNNYFVWSFQGLGGAIVRAGFKLEGDGETSIVTNGNGGHTLQIEKYPDGWYRCIIIANTQSSGSTTQFLYTVTGYSEHSSTPGGSVLLWGFQLEEGSFATSYIPTSSSAVTRAGDDVKITGETFADLYNPSESTIFFESGVAPTSNSKYFTFQGDDGGGTELIEAAASAGPGANVFTYCDGSVRANVSVTDSGATKLKYAAGVIKDNVNIAINGTLGTADTSAVHPDGINKLVIGNYSNGSYYLNNTIQKLTYYPKRLTDAQLQLLTS